MERLIYLVSWKTEPRSYCAFTTKAQVEESVRRTWHKFPERAHTIVWEEENKGKAGDVLEIERILLYDGIAVL